MFQYCLPEKRAAGYPMYSPRRDILYLMPYLVDKVPLQWRDRHLAFTKELCSRYGLDDAAVAAAFEAYGKFMELAVTEVGGPKIYNALEASGWLACSPAAQTFVLASIAQTLTYTYWHAVREVTVKGERSDTPMREFLAAAHEFQIYAAMPWWRRLCYRVGKWFSASYRTPQPHW